MIDPLHRGIEHLLSNEFDDAIRALDQAITLNRDDPFAHWNMATALLSLGDYRNGFREHDWGWRLFKWSKFDSERLRKLPVWQGEPAAHLLVYNELGHGDAIMAFRFLAELARRCNAVTLVVDRPLVTLAQHFDVEVTSTVPDDLDRFDCRLPLFGAMHALDVTVETIPADPYIGAHWQRHSGTIGICWAGNTQKQFSAEFFVGAFGDIGQLYSLKPGDVPHGLTPLDGDDFTATAKLIERLDHVVTVDTAVAHLAGAMGHPSTHVIVPFMMDWRWWHSEAWYPRIKVYRQSQRGHDWAEPFADVRRAIQSSRPS